MFANRVTQRHKMHDMTVLFVNPETWPVCVCVSQEICRNETLQWWAAVCYFTAAESSGGECKQSQHSQPNMLLSLLEKVLSV